ncbi:MAG: MMPL family transporter [Eubacteriales bacterium]|nr:MMPL family transporter [Eubacteriales bacterium]
MDRFFGAVIKRRKAIIIIFVCAAVVCGFLMLGVGQNYDMSKYLPAGSNSKTGIDILEDEYSYNGSAVLLLENMSIVEAVDTEKRIEAIDGVNNVVWLDDVADLKEPVELIDEEIVNNYLADDDALLQIVFEEDDYSETTHAAIDAIKTLLGEDSMLSGSAVDAYINVNSVSGNIFEGILIALAIVLVILLLSTNSFIEVVLFLVTIGIAILINMGTNIIFGEISYMTFACAAILQLAISMDYSIFLLHRFEYERKNESDPARAMAKASKASLSSIMSSGLTTIVGFIALIFMSYTMGADMGLVLAKGIVFSLLCVMILLPALTVGCVKVIDKTKHKRFLPSMKKVQHILSGKVKYVVVGLLIVVSVVCYMAQNSNTFLYSSSNVGDEAQDLINEKIKSEFGASNNFVILVPRGNETAESKMANEVDSLDYVKSVQGLYSYVDPATPEEIIPDNIKTAFLSEHYSRYIVEVNLNTESDGAMATVEEIRGIVSTWFDESYVTGASPVIYDIRQATSGDFSLVTILSVLFVGIILLLTFKSISIPIILLFIIETSIWINMSIPYFTGTPMIFIGYMIVSAVQLGATIDYAILMTNYYLEGRKTFEKRAAAEYAAEKAGASILISALVLTAAGFVVAATFEQQAMAQLGTLIGRGALLSGCMTIIVLPQVLILFDKLIQKTTLSKIRKKRRYNNEA